MLPLLLLACQTPSPPGDPTPWLPSVDRPIWTDGPVDGLATAWRFHGLLPASVVTRATCTLDADPEEVHVVEADAGRLPDLVVYGLLADEDYTCVLAAGGDEQARAIRTEPLPDWLPSWDLTVPGDAGGAYTLLNHGTSERGNRESKLLLVDADARLRWYLDVDYEAPDLDAQYLGDGQILFGGGYRAPPTRVDLSGAVLAEAVPSGSYHHHVEQLDDGMVFTLRTGWDEAAGDRWKGFSIDLLEPELRAIAWTWDSQRGVDDGWLPTQQDPLNEDPYHANGLAWLDDTVLVNLYELGWIAKIDRATGDEVWTLGPGRDFVLLDASGKPAPDEQWFWHTHAPEIEGDRVLVYDNGRDRPSKEEWSRALELELDEEERTARSVWEYREPGWYEPIWGDVDRLASGNVLILRAHCSHCSEHTEERTEVVEVDPATNEVVWRMTFRDPNDAGYRATRIDGCAIFANAKYCY